MKPQIISRQEIIEEDGRQMQLTRWYFSQDGIHEINLENLLEDRVLNCDWLDDKQTTLLVNYYDWDSNSVYALVSMKGEILRKGISFIESYLEEHEVMIATIMGIGLGSEHLYYSMDEFDTKVVVLDRWGRLILEPYFEEIIFIEEEQCFYTRSDSGQEEYFYPNGEKMERKIKRKLRKPKRLFKKRTSHKATMIGYKVISN